jgi:hypothetical protein
MATTFGVDLSYVNLHRNSPLPAHVGALSLVQGSDIHLGPTASNPHSPEGERLLRHELAHVVQHQGGPRRGRHHEGLAAGRILAASGHPIDTDW